MATVEISAEQYEQLIHNQKELAALHTFGVEKWENYKEAIASLDAPPVPPVDPAITDPLAFIKLAEGNEVLSTDKLSTGEILQARKEHRLFVDETTGLGWVIVPLTDPNAKAKD